MTWLEFLTAVGVGAASGVTGSFVGAWAVLRNERSRREWEAKASAAEARRDALHELQEAIEEFSDVAVAVASTRHAEKGVLEKFGGDATAAMAAHPELEDLLTEQARLVSERQQTLLRVSTRISSLNARIRDPELEQLTSDVMGHAKGDAGKGEMEAMLRDIKRLNSRVSGLLPPA